MNKILGPIEADTLTAESLPLRGYYEDMVLAQLASFWRRRLVILAAVAVALLLGILVAIVLPARYTADAFVRVGFTSSESASSNSGGSFIAVDASLLVETRSRVFKTHQLARRVVEQLGLERLGAEAGQGGLTSWFSGRTAGYREDVAAAKLLRNLTVKTDPRAYLITVSYSAGDPELAALTANAFVAASFKLYALQRLNEQRTSAQAALSEQVATLGERHPNVARARAKLATVEALLEAERLSTKREVESLSNDSVIAAQPIAVPSSPTPQLIIGVAFLAGLIAGFGIVVALDRGAVRVPQRKNARAGVRRAAHRTGARQAGDAPAANEQPPPPTNGADVPARHRPEQLP